MNRDAVVGQHVVHANSNVVALAKSKVPVLVFFDSRAGSTYIAWIT